jgi:hypothetical protein
VRLTVNSTTIAVCGFKAGPIKREQDLQFFSFIPHLNDLIIIRYIKPDALPMVMKQFARIEKRVCVPLVTTGVAFLTGGFQSVSLWLIDTFPQFGQVG